MGTWHYQPILCIFMTAFILYNCFHKILLKFKIQLLCYSLSYIDEFCSVLLGELYTFHLDIIIISPGYRFNSSVIQSFTSALAFVNWVCKFYLTQERIVDCLPKVPNQWMDSKSSTCEKKRENIKIKRILTLFDDPSEN